MKIRWVNTAVMPLPHASAWMRFVCRYPGLLLIPAAILAGIGLFFHRALVDLEAGRVTSVHVGKLKPLHDLFGTWGIDGFFGFLIAVCLYLFWFYAMSDPRGRQ